MVLLCDDAQVEAWFSPFGDSANPKGARFTPNVPQAHKSFWTYLMELLGDVSLMESRFGPFGDSVNVGAG
jgi:hypothetical protein